MVSEIQQQTKVTETDKEGADKGSKDASAAAKGNLQSDVNQTRQQNGNGAGSKDTKTEQTINNLFGPLEIVGDLFNKGVSAAEAAGKELAKVEQKVEEGVEKAVSKVEKAAGKTVDDVEKGEGKVVEKVEKAAEKTLDNVEKGAGKVVEKVEKAAEKTLDNVEKTTEKVVEKVDKAAEKALTKVENLADAAKTTVDGAFESVGKSFKGLKKELDIYGDWASKHPLESLAVDISAGVVLGGVIAAQAVPGLNVALDTLLIGAGVTSTAIQGSKAISQISKEGDWHKMTNQEKYSPEEVAAAKKEWKGETGGALVSVALTAGGLAAAGGKILNVAQKTFGAAEEASAAKAASGGANLSPAVKHTTEAVKKAWEQVCPLNGNVNSIKTIANSLTSAAKPTHGLGGGNAGKHTDDNQH